MVHGLTPLMSQNTYPEIVSEGARERGGGKERGGKERGVKGERDSVKFVLLR